MNESEYSCESREPFVPWVGEIEDQAPLTKEQLLADMNALRDAVVNEKPRPSIRLVSCTRYLALRDIHQMDGWGSECLRCGDYYAVVDLEKCVPKEKL